MILSIAMLNKLILIMYVWKLRQYSYGVVTGADVWMYWHKKYNTEKCKVAIMEILKTITSHLSQKDTEVDYLIKRIYSQW